MTGIILVGGKSSRFGRDKVITPIGDKPLIEHVMDVIRPIFDEVILIGHTRDNLDTFTIQKDIMPGLGPLGGIYTALNVSKTPYCFVFAADMPNLNRGLIEHMGSKAEDQDVILPVWSMGREPLHAIYNRRVIPIIKELLEKNNLKVFNLLSRVNTMKITEDTIRSYGDPEVIFANINTIHDIGRHII